MPKSTRIYLFQWEGIARHGERITGQQNATDVNEVKTDLRRRGIFPIRIKKQSIGFFKSVKIKPVDIAHFSRQVSTMLGAGIPLIQSLDLIARGCEKPALQLLIINLKTTIEGGRPVAEALQLYPAYFNPLYCNLVAAGEKSGNLDLMFNRIASYKEKFASLKAKIKKALFYPAAVLAIAFIISAGLLIFVVPQFASLFKNFGADLPLPTQIVIALSGFVQQYGWLILLITFGIIYVGKIAAKKSTHFLHWLDKYQLKLPIIGTILQKAAIARFARTLATTFSAGLPLIESLQTVAGATGNWVYQTAVDKMRDKITTGQTLKSAMQDTQVFPSMVNQMIGIGEASGTLELMLTKVASIYEEDVDNTVDSLTSLLEPFIMVILGLLVGGLVIAMYLPIFRLGSVIH